MIKVRDRYAPDFNYCCMPRNEGSYVRVNILEERRKVAYYMNARINFFEKTFLSSAIFHITSLARYSIILGIKTVSLCYETITRNKWKSQACVGNHIYIIITNENNTLQSTSIKKKN